MFAAALEAAPRDPDALDGLGQSLCWLGERDAGIDRRREAYAAERPAIGAITGNTKLHSRR